MVQRLTEDPSIYLANSMNSLRVEGQKTVALEIVQQFDWQVPDWVLIPGGNLGNVSALAKGFEMMLDLGVIARLPRIVCCQAQHADPLYLAFGARRRRPAAAGGGLCAAAGPHDAGVGDPDRGAGVAAEGRARAAALRRAGRGGQRGRARRRVRARRSIGDVQLPAHGRGAGVLAKLAKRGVIGRRERVIVISTAHGLKFTEFKARYHEGKLEFPSTYANQPVPMGSEPEEVVAALHRVLDARAG